MRPLQATIHLGALDNNLRQVQRLTPASKVVAVIKANAYGHQIDAIASYLQHSVEMFGVASMDEAIKVREAGVDTPILLLEGIFTADEATLVHQYGCIPVVHNRQQAAWLKRAAPQLPQLWIKLETGMHRLGWKPSPQDLSWLTEIADLVYMHHYACADTPDHPHNRLQSNRFVQYINGHKAPSSCANSAVICGQAGSDPIAPGTYVRPGIMLYGASPLQGVSSSALGLQPVMQLESTLIACNPVSAGETIGYGATFTAPADGYAGVVACGYGDGYPREFFGHTTPHQPYAEAAGHCFPLAGRVSMDLLTLWLGSKPLPIGSRVQLWGTNPTIAQLADWAGTIPYTLLSGVTQRVPRRHVCD